MIFLAFLSLAECNHPYCLSCIREWRSSDNGKTVIRWANVHMHIYDCSIHVFFFLTNFFQFSFWVPTCTHLNLTCAAGRRHAVVVEWESVQSATTKSLNPWIMFTLMGWTTRILRKKVTEGSPPSMYCQWSGEYSLWGRRHFASTASSNRYDPSGIHAKGKNSGWVLHAAADVLLRFELALNFLWFLRSATARKMVKFKHSNIPGEKRCPLKLIIFRACVC